MPMTLKAARINKNLTQRDAAKCLHISKETLGNYERGLSFPDVIVLERIFLLYKVSYDDIIFLPPNNA